MLFLWPILPNSHHIANPLPLSTELVSVEAKIDSKSAPYLFMLPTELASVEAEIE